MNKISLISAVLAGIASLVVFIALLYSIKSHADEIIWKQVKASADTHAVAQDYCGDKYQIIELGLVDGDTKIVRFICQ